MFGKTVAGALSGFNKAMKQLEAAIHAENAAAEKKEAEAEALIVKAEAIRADAIEHVRQCNRGRHALANLHKLIGE